MLQFTRTRFINKAGQVEYVSANVKVPYVHVKNGESTFHANNILSAYRATPVNPANDTLVITIAAGNDFKGVSAVDGTTAVASKYFRLALYVGDRGDCNPIFANNYVFKGKPMYIEFMKGETAAETAANIKDMATKYLNNWYDTPVFTVTTGDGASNAKTVTITATNEYLRFQKYDLEQLMTPAQAGTGAYGETRFVKITHADFAMALTVGHEGFGNFADLIKNVSLPTLEHTSWLPVYDEDRPIPGVQYTQYIIKMCADRGILGLSAVGQKTASITEHIFWVASNLTEEFEEEFNNLADGAEFFMDAPGNANLTTPEEVSVSVAATVASALSNGSNVVKKFNGTPVVKLASAADTDYAATAKADSDKVTATATKGKVTITTASATAGDYSFTAKDTDGSLVTIKVTVGA